MRQNKINKVDWQVITPSQAKAKIQETGRHGFRIGSITEQILAGQTVWFDDVNNLTEHPNFISTLANLPSEYEIHVGLPGEGYADSTPAREIGEYCILTNTYPRGSWNVYHKPNTAVFELLNNHYLQLAIHPYLIGLMLVVTSGKASLAYSVGTCEKIIEILFANSHLEYSDEVLALFGRYKSSEGPLVSPQHRFRLACDLVHGFVNLTK